MSKRIKNLYDIFIMKIFDNEDLKLAILYCLEKGYREKIWYRVKKITRKPSFLYFIHIISQIKKSGLYPTLKTKLKIKKNRKFYNMLFKHLIKYDYEIKNRLPVTNEKINYIIKKWNISKTLVKKFNDKYKKNINDVIIEYPFQKCVLYYFLFFYATVFTFMTLLHFGIF